VHFCADELFALMMLIPGLSFLATKLSAWWHRKVGCKHGHNTEAK
jgi:hypothetical protein